jgi:outer membrane biosynthesis protein TonB
MSTILKALRRLEEEDGNDAKSASGREASDPASVASGVLRDRILAEEVAAQTLAPDSASSSRRKQIALLAAVAVAGLVVLVAGANWILESDGAGSVGDEQAALAAASPETSTKNPAQRPAPGPAVAVAAARPTRERAVVPRPQPQPQEARRQPQAQPQPRRQPQPQPQTQRAVPPTTTAQRAPDASPSAAEKSRAAPAPVALPPPIVAVKVEEDAPKAAPVRVPAAAAAPAPALERAAVSPTPAAASNERPARDIRSLPEARSSAAAREAERPGAPLETPMAPNRESVTGPVASRSTGESDSLGSSRSRASESMDRPGLADVTVLRTSWHPSPERRSARVRVVETDETLTLREGDAIGGLVLREIKPSSVLFQAGDVEIRRKVGSRR